MLSYYSYGNFIQLNLFSLYIIVKLALKHPGNASGNTSLNGGFSMIELITAIFVISFLASASVAAVVKSARVARQTGIQETPELNGERAVAAHFYSADIPGNKTERQFSVFERGSAKAEIRGSLLRSPERKELH